MADVKEMILRDVRCFEGAQHGSMRPITLLVGENSTGKSTFLGCYSVLHRVLSGMDFDGRLDFNEEPFFLGSFRDIVRSRRGRSGRIDQFQLGFVLPPIRRGGNKSYEFLTTFSERGSQPIVSSFLWRFDAESYLETKRSDNDEVVVSIPNYQAKIDLPFPDAAFMLNVLIDADYFIRRNPKFRAIIEYLDELLPGRRSKTSQRRRAERLFDLLPSLPDLIPVAPLRSKPKRTYDPVRETAAPDGEHIPMLMMRLDHTAKSRWNALHDGLAQFGSQSGLFSDIKVKRHGKQMSAPTERAAARMCIIVDNDRLGRFLSDPADHDSAPIRTWLDRGHGIVEYATEERFRKEIARSAKDRLAE